MIKDISLKKVEYKSDPSRYGNERGVAPCLTGDGKGKKYS